MWDKAQTRDHYRQYYRCDASAGYDPLTEHRYHALLGRIERLRPPGRLVDIGCGAGHLLAVADARGWEAVGVEVSESALALLQGCTTTHGQAFPIIDQDILRAGLPSEGFDVVIMIEVLEHLDEPMPTLREAHRLLRPGGLLYLTTPNYDSLSRRLLGGRWRIVAEEHRCLFTTKALQRCLGRVGLRALSLRTKNIDVPHLLAGWGLQQASGHPTDRGSASQQLRRNVERHRWLRALKTSINAVLRVGKLGDTIELLAMKDRSSHASV